MDIQILDYNKKYEKDINSIVMNQWRVSFVHSNNVVGKVALNGNKFAGVCFGWPQEDYFYLDTICILDEYQHCGIGTKLLSSMIDKIKHMQMDNPAANCGGGGIKVYLLDNDGTGPNIPRAKKLFENFGFVFVKVIENYFAKENNYDYCPDCKHKPCICSAWEYELKF